MISDQLQIRTVEKADKQALLNAHAMLVSSLDDVDANLNFNREDDSMASHLVSTSPFLPMLRLLLTSEHRPTIPLSITWVPAVQQPLHLDG